MSPTQFKFTIGGFGGESHEVEWKLGKLWYRRAKGAYHWEPDVMASPTEDEWANFWRSMETAGVWRWQTIYYNEISDGTQWSLKLKYLDRQIRCGGSNAYPGSPGPDYSPRGDFAHFLKALRSLTGQPTIK